MRPVDPTCRRTLADISAYLDGELDDSACELIRRHCRGCRECRALVEGLRETIGLCRKAGEASLPAAVRRRARSRVRRLLAAKRPGRA